MLSYQHAYHAGSQADVHKHAILASVLSYLVQKPKPVTYLETHAGRGLYDLSGPEQLKTKEAEAGILRCEKHLSPDHPLSSVLKTVRDTYGANAYPGSPLIAETLLRTTDSLRLCELHPAEVTALKDTLATPHIVQDQGFGWANAQIPPKPRRGLLFIDPSYELKSDYQEVPRWVAKWHRKWPVGLILVWYPCLATGLESALVHGFQDLGIQNLAHTSIRFPAAKDNHRMIGSGLFAVNPPWGFEEMARLAEKAVLGPL